MTTALVLGGAGFIGTAIVRALEAAGSDVAIAGTSSRVDALTAERIAALAPVELVVFCAGSSSVAASAADPTGERAKTVEPLRRLVETMAHWPAPRLVFISSAAVYGNAMQLPTPETATCAPVSAYGVHKRECEQLLFDAALPSAIVRLFSVYGPGLRKQLLWDACKKALAHKETFAGTGAEERDWLHVTDAAALVLAAAAVASRDVPIFNGGSGIGVAVRDVLAPICLAMRADPPTFTGETRAGDPTKYLADITRARALGWAPQIELARGLAEYVAWFVEHG